MQKKWYSYVFVGIQFSCILGLFSTGPVLADGAWLAVQGVAIILGIWALLVMRQGILRIVPDVSDNAVLIRWGPYRFIRHPMYTAVILLMAALVSDSKTPLRLCLLVILCIDLIGKLLYEEKLLKQSFEGYETYCEKTWRLFPLIF